MKVRALRVAECGRFVEPVALEGLSGGLDLLIGPNEAGKSTLLKALRTRASDQSSLRKVGDWGSQAVSWRSAADRGGD